VDEKRSTERDEDFLTPNGHQKLLLRRISEGHGRQAGPTSYDEPVTKSYIKGRGVYRALLKRYHRKVLPVFQG